MTVTRSLPLAACLLLPFPLVGQQALIDNALRAAPASVSAKATVVDFTNRVLREGSNGWVCMPDNPDTPGDSPMCLDKPWLAFIGALMSGAERPTYEGVGIGYMLQGDFPVSNVNPFAKGPTADNDWIEDGGPHVMLLVSDLALLAGLPASPGKGPWVMWKGTPYAHVMIPAPRLGSH